MKKNFRNEVDQILNFYGDHNQQLPLSAYLGMTAEIGGANSFVAPQFVGLAAQHDAAGLQDVAVIGHRKSHAGVLLDQQYRGVAPDLRDDPEHRLHDDRRQSQRWLVQQQKPRLRHQAAGDRHQLQLPPPPGAAQRI